MIKLLGKKSRVAGKNSFTPFYISLAISFVLLFAACSKPAGLIGVIVQPEDSKLKIGYTDTATVYAYSRPDDSIRTDELSVNLIGSNMDPVFGNTTASVYLQFMLENADHSFGPNPKLDSVILHLLYADSYGDTNTMQTMRAYELLEDIYVDSVYYSNIDLDIGSVDFADFDFVPHLSDSTILDGDTLAPMLRVNLTANPELGEKLLKASVDDMASNEAFQAYFKGLFITTDAVSEGGSIVSYNILSNYSEMLLYYSNDDQDSLRFDYMISLLNATINKYDHNFETGNADFKQQVLYGDTTLASQNFYVQGVSGVATIIKIPNMKEWNKLGPVAINEAKLILSGSESDPLWGAPSKLSMAEIQDDGTFDYLVDQSEELEVYFGGSYVESTNSYTFRITRYIQALIDDPDKKDNGLYLINTGASVFPNRFIFDGFAPAADTARRIKLEILYTQLN